jgi:hypothetical protein
VGILNKLLGLSQTSDSNIRDTLFGDMPIAKWPRATPSESEFPWNQFIRARSQLDAGDTASAVATWRTLTQQRDLEPRHVLQAWHFLRTSGVYPHPTEAKSVLGVVIEVSLEQGLDLLAAYADHSARYYNFSGAGVIWERPDSSLDQQIDSLLSAAAVIVERIGPWNGERPAPPPVGQARLCFLTPSGLHFGQAPLELLSSDPEAGQVMQDATALMQGLIAKQGEQPGRSMTKRPGT